MNQPVEQQKKKQPRRIIQSQVLPNADGSHTIYVLCSDGSMWFKFGTSALWTLVDTKGVTDAE